MELTENICSCGRNLNESFISSKTHVSVRMMDRCVANCLFLLPHAGFVLLSTGMLVTIAAWRRYRHRNLDRERETSAYYPGRFPGHVLRWLVALSVLVAGLFLIAEGILSDRTYSGNDHGVSTQPHLLLPGIFTVAGIVVSIITFHLAEIWRLTHLLLLLFCYWTASFISTLLTLCFYASCGGNAPFTMKLLLLAVLTVLYGTLLLCELVAAMRIIFGFLRNRNQQHHGGQQLGDELLTGGGEGEGEVYYKDSRTCNLPSQLAFSWLGSLFLAGLRKPVTYEKLGRIPQTNSAKRVYAKFKAAIREERKSSSGKRLRPRLLRTLARAYWSRVAAAAGLKLVADVLGYVGPIAIGGITRFATNLLLDEKENVVPRPHDVTIAEFFSNGFVLVGCIFVSSLIQHVCHETSQHWMSVQGLHARSAIQSMVYEKSLRISTHAMSGAGIGHVTNHMSVDVNNIMYFFMNVNEIWAIPVKICIALLLLYRELGISAIMAASLFVVVIPVQIVVALSMAKTRESLLKYTDDRLKSSNELLQYIKQLKIYGWEFKFLDAVKSARNMELRHLRQIYTLFSATFSINAGAPIVVTLIAFTLYTQMADGLLTPAIAFTSLALFNQLTAPLFLLPYVFSLSADLRVSLKRLGDYLAGLEVAPKIELKDDDHGVDENENKSSVGKRIVGGHPRHPRGAGKRGGMTTVMKERTLDTLIEGDSVTDSENSDDVFFSDIDARSEMREADKHDGNHGNGYPDLVNGIVGPPVLNHSILTEPNGQSPDVLKHDVAIRIRNGVFAWDPEAGNPDIHDISIDIPLGKLTMIVGPVGSGKSSLLGAILGEMPMLKGSIQAQRDGCRISYAPQKPWLMNASLRKNILFGKKMNYKRYQRIVNACSLQPDIDMLPAKDRTEIGERGINLSGGQRQRVSVARAIYSSNDVVILDDPLSALDQHVGSELFNKGIVGILGANNQTVVLVTHHLQYLPHAAQIIVMENGSVKAKGSPAELARVHRDLEIRWTEAARRASEANFEKGDGSSTTELERKKLFRQCSRTVSILSCPGSETDNERGRLIVPEDREYGAVAMSNYSYYISAMGRGLALIICFCILLRVALQINADFWLSNWSDVGLNSTEHSDEARASQNYVWGFAGLSMATVTSQICFYFLVNAGIFTAARTLHSHLLENLVKIPTRFFDTTPVGRILNRLSTDTCLIDHRLLIAINMLINGLVSMVASIVVNVVVNVYFIVFFIPIAIAFVGLYTIFIRTSRELQRIESLSRSPIIAHFSETLGGLTTIRAFNAESRFTSVFSERLNANNLAFLYKLATERWLGIRMDILGSFVVLISGFCSLLGVAYLDMESSSVGLAISYSLMVSAHLNLLVRHCADLELQMNSVERVRYYSELPNEQYEGEDPPKSWPLEGRVDFEEVSLRYAKELVPVVRNVKAEIKPGQKIGICGRTGCGKSSLTLALFRMIDIFKGRVCIDGIDVTKVPLRALRSRLSIIPQDAVMFTGTIRSNLDLTNNHSDHDLWHSLEIAQLKTTVKLLNKGLESEVEEGGQNFSVGQRQLFCLARAFLQKSSILVMDEATASIDKETDRILQEVVADVFKERTAIIIAHRVETLLKSDRILTLDNGQVAEFGSPEELLRRKDGIFSSLVKAGT